MKQLIIIILLLQGTWLFAQEKSLVHKGNELYQQQKYKEAEADYRKSVEKKEKNLEGNFNLGDALYKQKKFEDAATEKNKAVVAGAYHNLGNSLLQNKKLEESIEAYKKALLNNPKDEETRYNLAYAQDKLKQQQQQKNKDNKDKKDQDKKNQDKKDQDKNKDDKNKDNKDNKNQDKKDQDKKDQQDQPNKLSKQDAERMLDALNNNEKQTQDKLKNKKLKGGKLNISKDW
jgi:Ca-activated chloride channel family protein